MAEGSLPALPPVGGAGNQLDTFNSTTATQPLPRPRPTTRPAAGSLSDLVTDTPTVVGTPKGLLEPGNIDLGARPVVKNKDGSTSTVRSISVEQDGKEVLIPTVSDDGKLLSNDDAIKAYEKTGRHLGVFADRKAADAYANALHNQQQTLYSKPSDYLGDLTTNEPKPDTRGELEKGLASGLIGANLKMAGGAAMGLGVLSDNSDLEAIGLNLNKMGQEQADFTQPRVPTFRDIRTDNPVNWLNDTLGFAGYQFANMVGTSVPSLVGGVAASALSANPMVGIAVGAAGPSYLQNFGDVYGSAIEDPAIVAKVASGQYSKKFVAGVSALAAVPIAALDVASLDTVVGKVFFDGAKRNLITRIVRGIAIGSITEGSTEGMQQVIQEWTNSYFGTDASLVDHVMNVLDSAIAGFIGGGGLGLIGGGAGGHGATAPAPGAPGAPPPAPAGVPKGATPADAVLPPVIDEAAIRREEQAKADAANPLAGMSPDDLLSTLKGAGYDDNAIAKMDAQDIREAVTKAKAAASAAAAPAPEAQKPATEGSANLQNPPAETAPAPAASATEAPPAPAHLADLVSATPHTDLTTNEAPAAAPGTRAAPVQVTDAAHVEAASTAVNTQPTPAQVAAGNYAKGHIDLNGLGITIENPKGSTRTGVGEDGKPWQVQMPAAYGYVKRTADNTGEQVDVYVGPNPTSDKVFVVDQLHPQSGQFDEPKAMLGFDTKDDALSHYSQGFSDGSGPDRVGKVTELSVDQFKQWLKAAADTHPSAFAEAKPKAETGKVKPEKPAPAVTHSKAIEKLLGMSGDVYARRRQMKDFPVDLKDIAAAAEKEGDYGRLADLASIVGDLTYEDPRPYVTTGKKKADKEKQAAAMAVWEARQVPRRALHDKIHTKLEAIMAKAFAASGFKDGDTLRFKGELWDGRSATEIKNPIGTIHYREGDSYASFHYRGAVSTFDPEELPRLEKLTAKDLVDHKINQRAETAALSKALLEGDRRDAEARAAKEAAKAQAKPGEGGSDRVTARDEPPPAETAAAAKPGQTYAEQTAAKNAEWSDFVALATDKTIDDFIAAFDKVSRPGFITQAIEYGLDYKKLSVANAMKALRADSVPRPSKDESEAALRASRAANMQGGAKKLHLSDQLPDPQRSWVKIDGINAKWLGYKAGFLVVTPAGEKIVGQKATEEITPKATPAKEKAAETAPKKITPQTAAEGPLAGVDDSGRVFVTVGGERMTAPEGMAPGSERLQGWLTGLTVLKGRDIRQDELVAMNRVGTGKSQPNAAAPAAKPLTWDDAVKALPKDSTGMPDTDLAFRAIAEVTGSKTLTFNELTDEQKAAVMARIQKRAAATAKPAVSETPPAPKSAEYGASNKLVSKDRAEELRARLRNKLKNQVSAGIDPEILSIGTELAVFHIEAGARKFVDLAKAIADDLGTTIQAIRPYLRGWYNGARDLMEDSGVDITGMDDAAAVGEAIKTLGAVNEQGSAGVQPNAPEVPGAGAPGTVGAAQGERPTGNASDAGGPASGGAAGAGVGAAGEERSAGSEGAAGPRRRNPDRGGRAGAKRTGVSAAPGLTEGQAEAEAAREPRTAKNYRITAEDHIGQGGPKEKVRANLAAIRLLKTIEEEKRQATADEKRILVKYVGWGAFAQDVFAKHKNDWAAEQAAVKDLLTPDEYAAARASTLNAHYTSEDVIKGVWAAVAHLGFSKGRAIEPSAGVGHFIGLQPDALAAHTAWTAVELDPITGRIAKLLYAGADVNVTGFENLNRPDNFYDLAISNVPFGDYTVRDTKARNYRIHDYFFVKALDLVRPGGVVAFITSSGTLDKTADRARNDIAKKAEFLGAIRLPGGKKGAFAGNAGTEVTTDIMFLRKRMPGVGIGMSLFEKKWQDTKPFQTKDGVTQINEYFVAHPEMMLGEMRLMGTMYRADTPVLVGDSENLTARIAKAAEVFPRNVIPDASSKATAPKDEPITPAPDAIKEGAFFVDKGKVFQKVAGMGQAAELSAVDADKVTRLVTLRTLYNLLLAKKGDPDTLRYGLNQNYDAFVKKYGPIGRVETTVTTRTTRAGDKVVIRKTPNFKAFRSDPDAFKVLALENYDEELNSATKAAIFTEDVLAQVEAPQITGPADAVAVSLDKHGKIVPEEIARLLGVKPADVMESLGDLTYRDPNGGEWKGASQYLSGDVLGKLHEAEAAAEADPAYKRNVEALKAVQPTRLTATDITAKLGAPWVPMDVVRQFITEEVGGQRVNVAYTKLTASWTVTKDSYFSQDAQAKYGTDRATVVDVLNAALNNTQVRIYDATAKGPEFNPKATEEAAVKVKALRVAFSGDSEQAIEGWAFRDAERRTRLEDIYNETHNRYVTQKVDGSHLTLPGLAKSIALSNGTVAIFKLRQHQKDAVWRVIQNGNTLLDHVVGAGKTFTMISAGMEQKRLGLITRPMFAVPNHMLDQFSREFLQAYPGANILVADKESMSAANRKLFAGRIAAERWDAIVITHDAFGRLGMSPDFERQFIQDQIDEYLQALEAAKREGGKKNPTVKQLESAIKKIEARLDKLVNKERKDSGATFEELGVDYLFVDEAHLFKNLAFATKMTRVKGLGQGDAQRATDLFMKIRYLEGSRPGRSATFATGTPISNTISEMFTMMRYLQLERLKEHGIDRFDAWAQTFGEVVTETALAPNGRTFQETSAFSRFVNIPELVSLFSQVADTRTAEMLNLPRPKLKGGKPIIVEAEPAPEEERYIASLVQRAESMKGKRVVKGGDNMLKIVTEGRKVATDFRLLRPDNAINPNGKTALAVERIHEIWKRTADKRSAQMVFLDMGTPQPAPNVERLKAEQLWDTLDLDARKDWARKAGSDKATITDEDAGRDWKELSTAERTHLTKAKPATASATTGQIDEFGNVLAVDIEDSELFQGKFNLYEDIRSRLVDKGIPKAEIAFIHEATDDAKKATLFEKVRAGRVRVLIGSTGKMGVGTNVQAKLFAMHHIDAPWKPAEVEQRDGRILRQGNENPEIEIYRYITKRSFDAYMWQTLERKAKFIGQIKAGARGVRTAEDIDDPLPEAAELKAAASGDPRIMEHAVLTKQVRDFETQRRVHERTIFESAHALKAARSQMDSLKSFASIRNADAALVQDMKGDNFTIDLSPIRAGVVEKREDAGKAIVAFLDGATKNVWADSQHAEHLRFGTFSGFEAGVLAWRTPDGVVVQPYLKGKGAYDSHWPMVFTAEADPAGFVRRVENILTAIPDIAKETQDRLAATEQSIPRLEEQATQKPFPREEAYRTAKTRLTDLTKALTPNKNGQASALGNTAARAQTQTPAFKEWFGDSKVVDGEGKPLVVYHGSGASFDTFRPGAFPGFYFAADHRLADFFARANAKGGAPQTYPAYLSLQNPKEVREGGPGLGARLKAWLSGRDATAEVVGVGGKASVLYPESVARLQAQGYDGISTTWDGDRVFIAFEPTQIKSATGNSGEFDPNNPSILGNTISDRAYGPIKMTPQQQRALEAKLRAIVKRVAGKDVKVWTFDTISAAGLGDAGYQRDMAGYAKDVGLLPTAGGEVQSFWDGTALVKLALRDPAFNPTSSAWHEAYHRVEMQLMSDAEFALVERPDAIAKARDMAAVEMGFKPGSPQANLPGYEARAVAFERYARMRDAGQPVHTLGLPRSLALLFEKIWRALRELKQWLVGQGFRSLDDVFEAAYQGQFAERADVGYRNTRDVTQAQGEGSDLGSTRSAAMPTETPAFKAWFGGSAVTDETGQPLRVFHGTTASFDAFDEGKLGTSTFHPTATLGFWFSADHAVADLFTQAVDDGQWPPKLVRRSGANLMPVYLSIKKPFQMSVEQFRAIQAVPYGADFEAEQPNAAVRQRERMAHNKQRLLDLGYDGILVKGDAKYADDISGQEYSADAWVAFHPEQVKSAIANQGAFDPVVASVLGNVLGDRDGNPFAEGTAEARQHAMMRSVEVAPLDRVMRLPFDIFGGRNRKGEWKPGLWLSKKSGDIITNARFDDGSRFSFLNPILHKARAGLIDRYGLPEEYVTRDRERALEERALLAEVPEVMQTLKDANVGTAEAHVLQRILTGEEIPDAQWKALSEPIRNAIDSFGAEAVELGLLSPEAFERNRGKYLHRVYVKHEAEQGTLTGMVSGMMRSRRKKLIANELKGRGLWQNVPIGKLPEGLKVGDHVEVFDHLAEGGRVTKREYVAAGEQGPEGTTSRGTWEVRARKGSNFILWRDWTKAEREQMGEINDARYTIAKTYMLMAHDLAVGRFYKDISENPDWATAEEPDAAWKNPGDYKFWQRTYDDVEWIKVPDATIPKSNTRKWGALAGMWVRAEIWRDLNELEHMNRSGLWSALMTQWKLNKTARSPVVHMNNIMSNFVLLDMSGVGSFDLVRAIRSYTTGDAMYEEANHHGAFGVDMASQEIRKNVLGPLLEEIRDTTLGGKSPLEARLGILGKLANAIWSATKTVDRKMLDLYRLEDEVFRMALYVRRRSQGVSAQEAADEARQQFIDYDIRAPWINTARRTVLPFLAYSYRAIPLLARTTMTRPWKIAKYAAVAYAVNALAYMLFPGDEDRERRSMREDAQGRTWLGGFPRMVRMPWGDKYGNPMFFDVRRWIPAGDVFDTNSGQLGDLGVPAWLQFGGPLMLAGELALNKQAFTGDPIWNSLTDDWWDKSSKVGDWAWKSWAPSAAWVPGSWYWEKMASALKGARDWSGQPFDIPSAALSSIGVKVTPQDVEDGFRLWGLQFKKIETDLRSQMGALGRDYQRGMMSDAEFNRQRERLAAKIAGLNAKAQYIFSGQRP